jgi:hypothetical protein
LNLKVGDELEVGLNDQTLLVRRAKPQVAKLKRGEFGRLVLVAPKGAPEMTTESVLALLREIP